MSYAVYGEVYHINKRTYNNQTNVTESIIEKRAVANKYSDWCWYIIKRKVTETYFSVNYYICATPIGGKNNRRYDLQLSDSEITTTQTTKYVVGKDNVITNTSKFIGSTTTLDNNFKDGLLICQDYKDDAFPDSTIYHNFVTALPIFDYDDNESILKYVTNGDTSGAIKDFSTKWTLYIDGKSNPLYKLTWECDGLKDIDTTYTDISIWVGTYNVFDETFNDDDGTKFKNVNYDKHSVKFSYSDLEKLVPQPLVGHNPPSIRVQLGYREFPTARFETSASMGCELYFDSHPQNTLYTELGYLTMENGTWHRTQEGDGSTFTVKDGQEGSDGYTEDNDSGYDDGKDNDEKDNDTGDVSAGIGVLTSTFKMTKERLVQLGQFLWGANIFDKFSLVNNNPIENIISCKSIPINTDGTNQEIILGNVSTGVNGEKISNNFAKQTIGSIAITEHYHNFLDYAPYTNVILYLPYIGFKELDTTLVMNKTLQVIYTVDAITGGCLAQVYVNSVRLYEFTGNVGIDIPITASNRAQVEAGYIQAGVGATASALGGNVGSAVTSLLNSATSQYHYSSTGNPSPMCVASTNRTCYVIIDRPNYQNLKAFNHTRGRKCYLSKTISTLHGFTICDSNIDLSGINATQSELEELKEILSSGFYV